MVTVQSFWVEVLEAWCKINYKDNIDHNNSMEQIIWANSHIRINGIPIVWIPLMQVGIKTVSDLLNNDGTFYDYDQFVVRYGKCLTWLEYMSLKKAIPITWFCVDLELSVSIFENESMYDRLQKLPSVSRTVYSIYCTDQYCLNKYHDRWVSKGIEIDYNSYWKAFMQLYGVTISIKYRNFQYRFCYIWRMKDSDLCYFCGLYSETTIHLLYECKVVRSLWSRIEQWLISNLTLTDTLDFNISNVKFNLVYPVPTHLCNMIVLTAKQYIYRTRCMERQLNLNDIISIVKSLHSFELYYAKSQGKINKHCKKWKALP